MGIPDPDTPDIKVPEEVTKPACCDGKCAQDKEADVDPASSCENGECCCKPDSPETK